MKSLPPDLVSNGARRGSPKRLRLRSIALAAVGSLVAMATGLGGPLATIAPAHAQPPITVSTLTGETLRGGGLSGGLARCPSPTYSPHFVAAAGPYPGSVTFPGTATETGTWTVEPFTFSAGFTITSGTITVTGSKSTPGMFGPADFWSCVDFSKPSYLPNAFLVLSYVPYTATIHTPDGNFHDEGVSTVRVEVSIAPGATALRESFTSSLAQPLLIVPTSTEQCKAGGWRNYPQFKNQGQCVSLVEHQP
jgi:hypothetical protein